MDTVQNTPEVKPSAPKKKNTKLFLIIGIAAVVVIAAVIVGIILFSGESKGDKYDAAIAALEEGQIDDAVDIYKELGEYKDLGEKIKETALDEAEDYLKRKDYVHFVRVAGYVKDYEAILGEMKELADDEAKDLMKKKDYSATLELYNRLKKLQPLQAVVEARYAEGVTAALDSDQFSTAMEMFYQMDNQGTQMESVNEALYAGAIKQSEKENFDVALDLLELIPDYKDSAERKEQIRVSTYLQELKYYLENGNYYWAEDLIQNYDGDKQPLIDEYLKYCGDTTVLEDLEKALLARQKVEEKGTYSYTELINAEWELLSKYEDMPFYDDKLQELFLDYFYDLEDQKYYADTFDGYNYYEFYERTYYWDLCDAERFAALEVLYEEYEFGKGNQQVKSIFLDKSESVRAYAEAGYQLSRDIDSEIYWGDVSEDENGTKYIVYKNETVYTFDLTIYHFDENGEIVEADTVSYTDVAPDQEIQIPVGVVGSNSWDTTWWELGWSITKITGGSLT